MGPVFFIQRRAHPGHECHPIGSGSFSGCRDENRADDDRRDDHDARDYRRSGGDAGDYGGCGNARVRVRDGADDGRCGARYDLRGGSDGDVEDNWMSENNRDGSRRRRKHSRRVPRRPA